MDYVCISSYLLGSGTKSYAGVGIALPIIEYGTLPLLGIQVGTLVADNVELRANNDTLIVFAGFLELMFYIQMMFYIQILFQILMPGGMPVAV